MSHASIMEGTWQMVRAEFSGETAPDLVVQHTTFVLSGGEYAVRFEGRVVDKGTYEAGGTIGATTLLLHGTSGPNAGRVIPCVYQLKGDRLRVCFGLNGVAPADFTTNATNQRYLAVYRKL